MTDVQVEGLIKYATTCVTAAVLLGTIAWKYYEYKTTQSNNDSAKGAAIIGLLKADEKMQGDIADLQKRHGIHEDDIREIKQDQKAITDRFLDYFRYKKND